MDGLDQIRESVKRQPITRGDLCRCIGRLVETHKLTFQQIASQTEHSPEQIRHLYNLYRSKYQ